MLFIFLQMAFWAKKFSGLSRNALQLASLIRWIVHFLNGFILRARFFKFPIEKFATVRDRWSLVVLWTAPSVFFSNFPPRMETQASPITPPFHYNIYHSAKSHYNNESVLGNSKISLVLFFMMLTCIDVVNNSLFG